MPLMSLDNTKLRINHRRARFRNYKQVNMLRDQNKNETELMKK
jgi:hypothetical protein